MWCLYALGIDVLIQNDGHCRHLFRTLFMVHPKFMVSYSSSLAAIPGLMPYVDRSMWSWPMRMFVMASQVVCGLVDIW